LHTNGANFLFADGSARFFHYSINNILPQMMSRNGGEAYPQP